MSKSVYRYSATEAKRFGELPEWRESHKKNCACANDIETAIRENFDGMHLNESCVKPVIEKHGFANIGGHTIEAGYSDSSNSYIRFDGQTIAEKKRLL